MQEQEMQEMQEMQEEQEEQEKQEEQEERRSRSGSRISIAEEFDGGARVGSAQMIEVTGGG
eukprot:SAG11_NODE_2619_length_3169_cov_5.194788_6_plen_61_part_00